jgi:Skp family chaperone for outer membrane proteins
MKKIFAILSTLSLLFIASPAFAQQGNNTKAQNRPEAVSQRLGELEQNRQQHYQEVLTRVTSKFQTRLERYSQFIVKLEAKRAELNASGADVSELDNTLRQAKLQLGNTRGAINAAGSVFQNLDYSQNRAQLRTQVTGEINKVRQEFRTLHQHMTQAVRQIGQLSSQL